MSAISILRALIHSNLLAKNLLLYKQGAGPFCCNRREWLIFSLHASAFCRLRDTRKKKSFAMFCLCDHGDFPAVCSSCVSLESEWNGAIASCNIGQYRLLLLRQTDSCGCLDFMHIFNSHLLTARVTRKASIRPQHQLTSPVFSLEKLYQRHPSATTNTIKHATKTLCLNPSSTPTNQSFRLQQHRQRQQTTNLQSIHYFISFHSSGCIMRKLCSLQLVSAPVI
jgi:hypothetical protein